MNPDGSDASLGKGAGKTEQRNSFSVTIHNSGNSLLRAQQRRGETETQLGLAKEGGISLIGYLRDM